MKKILATLFLVFGLISQVFAAGGARFVTDDNLAKTPFAEDKDFAKRKEELKGRVGSLRDSRGVKLVICGNTAKEFGIEDKLYKGVAIVSSGVVEVASLQEQGFSYIKIQ